MAEVVVKTVEELKSVRKFRSHPVILIQGELASNLLIAGILRPNESDAARGEVVQLKTPGSTMYAVIEILHELSRANCFEIIGQSGSKLIKISPKPFVRREGN